jgi:8-oxo-dGTP pyrophosphatase MutT (NUDIX family)
MGDVSSPHLAEDPGGQEAPQPPQEFPVRYAARVILLDPQDRVLLMRYDAPPPNGVHWSTPGGGVEPGESHHDAALRELAEETGWSDIALLGEVVRHSNVVSIGSRPVLQYERLFLARTDQPARPITGVDAMHLSDGIAAWHWWTLAELDATNESVWPAGLAGLIRTVI